MAACGAAVCVCHHIAHAAPINTQVDSLTLTLTLTPRSIPGGSPTTRLAAAARWRARTRLTWHRRSTTTTARRARRAPKGLALGGSRHPARLRPRPRGVSALLAPGRATHAGGGGPIEPGEGCRGATRGFWPKPPSRAAFVSRRVLDPIFRHLNSGGEWKQHGFFWKDYEVSSW